MNTHHKLTSLAFSLLMGPALAASALTVTIAPGQFRGSNSGGEFVAVVDGSYLEDYSPSALQKVNTARGASLGFSTFCLERNERIRYGSSYEGELNQRCFAGGVDNHDPAGPLAAGDPISKATAFLYSQFAQGILAGYAFGDGSDGYNATEIAARKASATSLQSAIWYFEDELSLKSPLTNPFVQAAIDRFGEAGAFLPSDGMFGVSAVNLTSNGQKRQDILIFQVPDGGATLVMLGGGILGSWMMAARRRKA